MEFGSPHLDIREPSEASPTAPLHVRRLLARRQVSVAGEWHLWLYCCAWQVLERGRVVGDWTTNPRIERAAAKLNGQKLLSVAVAKRGVSTTFEFDLGGRLETTPFNRSGEQWHLYEPGGTVLTIKAGRFYSHEDGDVSPGAKMWHKF